jgi:CheY-like chemotaxis protein
VSRLSVEVSPASGGGELVLLLTDSRPVDLLITDVDLPWMTGLHVAFSARNSGLDSPIILLAANPNDDMRKMTERLGMAVLVELSARPDALLSIIREQLLLPDMRQPLSAIG